MLRTFLSQPSSIGDKLNIDILWIGKIDTSNWQHDESWTTKIKGIIWDYDVRPQFKIRIIDWSNISGLAGTLDLSKCTQIGQFYAANNKFSVLKFGKNPNITRVSCNNNTLASLDVSECPALINFSCTNNKLTTLNIEKNKALTYLHCENNQLTTLNTSQNKLLSHLSCWNNSLTELNIEQNIALTELSCSNNHLTSLNTTSNLLLTKLFCNNNELTKLDVKNNKALTLIHCYNNLLRHSCLPILLQKYLTNYKCYPQNTIFLGTYNAHDTINLRKEYAIADENGETQISKFSWFYIENAVEKPIPSKFMRSFNGLFVFGNTLKNKKIRCKITNTAIGNFPLIYEIEIAP